MYNLVSHLIEFYFNTWLSYFFEEEFWVIGRPPSPFIERERKKTQKIKRETLSKKSNMITY